MRKLLVLGLVLLVAAGLSVTAVSAKSVKTEFDVNGPHYNLNLLGKNWEQGSHEDQFDNPDRGTMFVPLDTSTYSYSIISKYHGTITESWMDGIQINITQNNEADDFSVLDGNAIDDGKCALEIPAGKYRLFIAVKAKNPKNLDAYTNITGYVFVENTTAYWLIDVGSVTVKKSTGWVDGTDMLFVDPAENPDEFDALVDLTTMNGYDAALGGLWVFDYMGAYFSAINDILDDDLENAFYFWDFDNHGNKQIKLQFYPI